MKKTTAKNNIYISSEVGIFGMEIHSPSLNQGVSTSDGSYIPTGPHPPIYPFNSYILKNYFVLTLEKNDYSQMETNVSRGHRLSHFCIKYSLKGQVSLYRTAKYMIALGRHSLLMHLKRFVKTPAQCISQGNQGCYEPFIEFNSGISL